MRAVCLDSRLAQLNLISVWFLAEFLPLNRPPEVQPPRHQTLLFLVASTLATTW